MVKSRTDWDRNTVCLVFHKLNPHIDARVQHLIEHFDMYGLLEFLPRLIEPGSAFRATTLELLIPFGIPDLVNSIIEVGYPI